MKPNKILAEIRQTRDALARETGYDLKRLFDYVRARREVRLSSAKGARTARPRSFLESAMLLALLAPFPLPAHAQVNSGSNGSDGAFNPTTNIVISMVSPHPRASCQPFTPSSEP